MNLHKASSKDSDDCASLRLVETDCYYKDHLVSFLLMDIVWSILFSIQPEPPSAVLPKTTQTVMYFGLKGTGFSSPM